MESKKVSVIIPVYNTEEYLSNCINSVLNQTYKNIEVILINDGSTDYSGKMCEEYAEKDSRIKVFHQKNAGVSVARNVGINTATGEYIQFVDSDDYIEPDMTEGLVGAMSYGTQLVICGFKSIYLDEDTTITNSHIYPFEGRYKKKEFLVFFGGIFKKLFLNSPCNKLYVNDIIKNNGLHFIEDLNMGEDLLFNLEYMNVCEVISTLSTPLYNYINFGVNSLTASFKKDFFKSQQMLFLKVREFVIENNCYTGDNKDYIEVSYTDNVISCLENLFHKKSNLPLKAKKEQISEIIYDGYVNRNLSYFKSGSIQKRFVGILIKYKLEISILWYFIVKTFLRNNMKQLFLLLKRINSR